MLTNGMTIKTRIGLAMMFLSALVLALGTLGLSGMGKASDATRDMYSNQMPAVVAIGMAESYAARERLALDRAAMHAGQADETKKNFDRAAVLHAVSEDWWKKYLALPHAPDQDKLAQDVNAKRAALQVVISAYKDAISANDHDKILSTADDLQGAFVALSKSDDTLSKVRFSQAKAGFDDAESNYDTFKVVTVAMLVAALVADAKHAAGLSAGVQNSLGADSVERERLFAKHLLAGFESGDRHFLVQHMRRHHRDRVDVGPLEQVSIVNDEIETLRGGKRRDGIVIDVATRHYLEARTFR